MLGLRRGCSAGSSPPVCSRSSSSEEGEGFFLARIFVWVCLPLVSSACPYHGGEDREEDD